MAHLVVGHNTAFALTQGAVLALQAHHHPVGGFFEVHHFNFVGAPPCSQQGSFIHQIFQFSAGKTGGTRRNDIQIDVFAQDDMPGMDFQNGASPFAVRFINHNLAVKASRAQQRGIKHFRPVGSPHDDHTGAAVKTVHFRQELIQGLLPLLMGDGGLMPAP